MAYGQTVETVAASQPQAKAGADTLNQINANSQYTSFGRTPGPAPKPVAAKSLAHGATELASLQVEWNTLCNLFGWKGTGGTRRRQRKSKSRTRRGRKAARKTQKRQIRRLRRPRR
jgi:hypothetical protein